MGFSDISKGYKLYDVDTNKVFINRDVKFDEGSQWNWEKSLIESFKNLNISAYLIPRINRDEEKDLEDENLVVRGTRSLSDIYERCNSMIMEPNSIAEATTDKDWLQAMKNKVEMIHKSKTWVLVQRPSDHKVIGVKWIFKTKLNTDDLVNKLEARLVVKGKLCKNYGSSLAGESRYRSLVGCLLHLSAPRLDIMYFASALLKFMQTPSDLQLMATKRVLKNIKGTADFGLMFNKNESENLLGYCDNDWSRSIENSRSTSNFCFSFASVVFAWNCKKQDVVA
ncbi:uncharacterized protein LOC110414887 [Herrania umbratica]|uniref:Uncharacterized protein LOC110414887 n=1 Tax=Herrania umbratica TaxID=108875 RepID=A0A6J1A540_9ROSI|nr:uncharacterized protein LOC110414887 [Herrania umbratica]